MPAILVFMVAVPNPCAWLFLLAAVHLKITVLRSPKMSPTDGQQSPKARKPGWRVVLGRAAWSRYTYERPEGDDLTLLGSVSKGAQVGALAMTAEGAYVQVVGDYLVPLKTKEIAKAVANAPREPKPNFSRDSPPWQAADNESPAPVVIVKKRRVAIMP